MQHGLVVVTEVKSDHPQFGLSSSLVREDAFLVALQLRDYPVHEYWEDGKSASTAALQAGATTIYDLKRDPVFLINNPFHSVHFYFPRAALNRIAEDAHGSPVDELRYRPGEGVDDRVMRGLTHSLLPAFEHPEQANGLFVEQVTLAVGVHAACTYGGMKAIQRVVRGGLAPWQEKRAIAFLDANLGREVSLSALAQECGLSASHFARAFRKSTGMAPYQWLLRRRVEKARHQLRSTDAPLTDIGLACGFADQSHFTRVFAKVVGMSPGSWRRQVRS
jgi:AraC family transcriptional regulator